MCASMAIKISARVWHRAQAEEGVSRNDKILNFQLKCASCGRNAESVWNNAEKKCHAEMCDLKRQPSL
jgi:hypothetical protein